MGSRLEKKKSVALKSRQRQSVSRAKTTNYDQAIGHSVNRGGTVCYNIDVMRSVP